MDLARELGTLKSTHRRTRWTRTGASYGGTRKLTFWLVVVDAFRGEKESWKWKRARKDEVSKWTTTTTTVAERRHEMAGERHQSSRYELETELIVRLLVVEGGCGKIINWSWQSLRWPQGDDEWRRRCGGTIPFCFCTKELHCSDSFVQGRQRHIERKF